MAAWLACAASAFGQVTPFGRFDEERLAAQARESRKAIVESLERAKASDDVAQQADDALFLGFIDMALSDIPSARSALTESASHYEALGENSGAWMALWALAEVEKIAGRYPEAAAVYERIIPILDKATHSRERFSSRPLNVLVRFFGKSFLPFGDLPGGREGAADGFFKPILLFLARSITHHGYGVALIQMGKFDEAETHLMLARQSSALFPGMFDADIAVQMGNLRVKQWRLDEARDEYRRALEDGPIELINLLDTDTRFRVLEKLGELELLTGRTDAALAWNDQAREAARKLKDYRREAAILEDRGMLLYRARQFDNAQAAFERAEKVAAPLGAKGNRGEIAASLGLLELTRGRYDIATAHYHRATELYRESGDAHAEANAWAMLAQCYDLMDMHDNATRALEKADALAMKGGVPGMRILVGLTRSVQNYVTGKLTKAEMMQAIERAFAGADAQKAFGPEGARMLARFLYDVVEMKSPSPRNLPAEVVPFAMAVAAFMEGPALIVKKDYAGARARVEEALKETVSIDMRAGLYAILGLTWAVEDKFEKAAEALQESAKTLDAAIDDIRVEEAISGYLGGRNFYFLFLIEMLLKQGKVQQAFEVSERARARAFLRLISNARIAPSRGADAELMREADALRTEIADLERKFGFGIVPEDVPPELQKIRERYGAVLTEIKTASSEYVVITAVKPLNVDEVRSRLSPDTTLVSYFVSPWGVQAWTMDRDSIRHFRLPDAQAVKEQAGCWSQEMGKLPRGIKPPSVGNPPCGRRLDAKEKYRALFAPLRPFLKRRHLVIVPHDSLHYVSFAGLQNPKTGRYVIEDFTVTYAPSASTLRFLSEKETPVDGTAVVFGNPEIPTVVGLPDAEREALKIAEAFGTVPLVGPDATESVLYQLDGKADLLHIAAHGFYDSVNPMFSGIVLAPGDGHNGILEVHEILGALDLTGVNLVVLSACRSGVGKRSSGDDVVGLTRALMYAGAPGVVATLWDVDDAPAAALVDEFYCRLLAGDSPAEALRFAQITLLHGREFANPDAWSAFALYGDPQGRWSAGQAGGRTRSPQDGQ